MCPSATATVNLRVEGKTTTIFEGEVSTTYRRVTTPTGGTRHCNGQNNDNNPCAGPTCTTALADALIMPPSFDAKYDERYDDLEITRIADETPVATEFWSICRNFVPTPVGGCQQIVVQGDQVLFAYAHAFNNPNPTTTYLKLSGPTTAPPGNVTLTVTDGGGLPISNVTVKEATGVPGQGITDERGNVTFNLEEVRTYKFKADKNDNLVSIRPNRHDVVVLGPQ